MPRNGLLTRVTNCTARTFHLAAVQLDHAGAAVSLLAIHRNFDPHPSGNDGELLADDGTGHRLAVDGHLLVVIRPVLEAFVLGFPQGLVVRERALFRE